MRTAWRLQFWARQVHRWVGWLIGVQALLWMLGGLYMTAVSIDVIHGEYLVHVPVSTLRPADVVVTPEALRARLPGLTALRLKSWHGRAVYETRTPDGSQLIDARTGARLDPLSADTVRALAGALHRGSAPIRNATLLETVPAEVGNRPAPLWRVDFDDGRGTSLYISPGTGELLAKRHTLWRAFDFMWMLHIMDYRQRSNINNNVLRIAALVASAFAATGIWLLWLTLRRRRVAR